MRISREILNRPTMLKALIVLKDSGPMTLSALSRALGTNKRRLKVYLEFLVSEGYVGVEECCGVRTYYLKEEIEL
ncbi:transcriptional regulator [Ignicoccus hospitalis]|uniref:Putative transcriptional regulator n=1 Tax=Ignicoccus hospitalis (strain KIN4/I / DSM 18386 / JCM 14125) TaxID=453591 RepID=A8AC20_IGNH4|nr:transcriptional regulator [Ignicoccus hospitalis]ABU82472.1 putative transcriptional regulator [Ignicoccus hospitalis KIN4/I]HIH90567.1 transcriptional regulator [Desulfurococcaceae archaeon]